MADLFTTPAFVAITTALAAVRAGRGRPRPDAGTGAAGSLGRAVVLAAALALAAFLGTSRQARAQVSPGPLSAPHASIDGTTQCLNCHAAGGAKKGMDGRCLACHTEIGWMKARNRGTHARTGTKECASCHPDHGGRDFQLVIWESGTPEKFDHRKAGYALDGRHAAVECRKCHAPANQKSGAAPLIRKKNRAGSWLGLETACASCHADPHRGQLGRDCAGCHSTADWKPARGFDHAKTAFALTGEHAKVECARCHQTPAVSTVRDAKGQLVPQWKPLAHGDCVSCHKDPHEGRFKGACAKCHVTTGWKVIGKQNFNHDQTRYPLRGKHAAVECKGCHDPRQGFGEKPKFTRCLDCHADAHAGKATLLGQVVDCASCHTVDGFDRSTYAVAAHAQSKYPLQGGHAATACEKCHRQLPDTPAARTAWGSARVVLRPGFTRCVACHYDPHRGRFEPTGARPHRDGCISCHGMTAFHPSKYDGVMHADCVFPLREAHQAVPCQRCHEELKPRATDWSLPADSARVRALPFDNPRRKCADCHDNPHGPQFGWRRDKGACDGCHDDRAFVPASRFDHNRDARYKLEGAHLKTPCASCHVPQRDSAGKTFVSYRTTPSKCESCHATNMRDSSLTAPPKPSRSSSAIPERAGGRLALWSTREAGHGQNL